MPATRVPLRATRSTAATSPRARPACPSPSTCRPRPATTPTTCSRAARWARSASRSATSATWQRSSTTIPLREMNTSMTINATAMWLLALYQVAAERQAEAAGRGPRRVGARPGRDDAERHHQGVPLARDLRLPARSVAAAHHRHGHLHGARDPEVEPDQHLQLPPAGGRGHAGAGDRLRHVDGGRGARRRARLGAGATRGVRRASSPGSPSSSTPACASSRRCARCAPSSSCGTS